MMWAVLKLASIIVFLWDSQSLAFPTKSESSSSSEKSHSHEQAFPKTTEPPPPPPPPPKKKGSSSSSSKNYPFLGNQKVHRNGTSSGWSTSWSESSDTKWAANEGPKTEYHFGAPVQPPPPPPQQQGFFGPPPQQQQQQFGYRPQPFFGPPPQQFGHHPFQFGPPPFWGPQFGGQQWGYPMMMNHGAYGGAPQRESPTEHESHEDEENYEEGKPLTKEQKKGKGK